MNEHVNISTQTLHFPLQWHGSLILESIPEEAARAAIEQTLHGCGQHVFSVTPGNASAQGRFRTWKISTVFADITAFRLTTKALGSLPGTRMLI